MAGFMRCGTGELTRAQGLIGEQWIRIRQVEEEHPPKTIDGYNPEFLGAKPARAGEDY
jgi:hypothetical protein